MYNKYILYAFIIFIYIYITLEIIIVKYLYEMMHFEIYFI